ncbi:HmuY family protein [Wenyingzhuangia sp. chi5]|uniref:HmuY family protein n=1 Tax=Wenyingzhuangia gilva TaxID=3057677 RepID=A0ABT8VSH6_9FLAO|nr:HmuY family protein [Wenyingzhuangia sp. chi5]MDO3694892.1 HmuY family protein [Wenyingzhuangia sp. chi5]
MNTIKFLTFAILFAFTTISCNDDNDDNIATSELKVKTVSNLHALQESDYTTNPPTISGDYIKFSFSTGTTTTGEDWDIAFRGTTILVNSGTATAADQPARTGNAQLYIANETTFANVTEVDTSLFKSDDATNGLAIAVAPNNGWYSYSGEPYHRITSTSGKIIVIKTNDGHYAKMEIESYYKDKDASNSANPDNSISGAQYYTFKYVYQAENTTKF